ncbi:MAG: hypothetical protein RL071_3880, partial [Pseudomonadota bacterium]
ASAPPRLCRPTQAEAFAATSSSPKTAPKRADPGGFQRGAIARRRAAPRRAKPARGPALARDARGRAGPLPPGVRGRGPPPACAKPIESDEKPAPSNRNRPRPAKRNPGARRKRVTQPKRAPATAKDPRRRASAEKAPRLRRAEKAPRLRRAEKAPRLRRAEKAPRLRRAEKAPRLRRAEKAPRLRRSDHPPGAPAGTPPPAGAEPSRPGCKCGRLTKTRQRSSNTGALIFWQ